MTTEPKDLERENVVSPANRSYRCRICDSEATHAFAAREMMYGTREVFWYFECPDCGCVQIAEIPGDLGRFYPPNYYSMEVPSRSWQRRLKGPILRALLAAGRAVPPLGRSLQQLHPQLQLLFLYQAAAKARRDARILDVGCGVGLLLEYLVDTGYRDSVGIDPFIAAERSYRNRILVRQADIFVVDGRFDVISFNHSLEHMPDQHLVLIRHVL